MLMITGYTRPLYLLPFDHRASYISGLFGLDVEANRLSTEEAATHIAHNFEAWIHIFEEARSA